MLATIPSRALFSLLREKYNLKCLSATFSARITWSNPSARSNLLATVNLDDGIAMLDRKPYTAFGTTRPDDCAAAACLHAHQKPMGAFSFNYGWLVGAFHVYSFVNRKTRYYKALTHMCQVYFAFLPVDKFELAM